MSDIYFISDLHLNNNEPSVIEKFIHFLKKKAINARKLFILGDLFEYWIGDEALFDELPSRILYELSILKQTGTEIFFMHGNRDFLIGDNFFEKSSVVRINDPYVIEHEKKKYVLLHGDTLCTDDINYQQFRKIVRKKSWQLEFLSKPIKDRLKIAESVRDFSKNQKTRKSQKIMDVNNLAVQNVFRKYNYITMIHGHTHRPKDHKHIIDEKKCLRYVLSDWSQYNNISYLVCNGEGVTRETL